MKRKRQQDGATLIAMETKPEMNYGSIAMVTTLCVCLYLFLCILGPVIQRLVFLGPQWNLVPELDTRVKGGHVVCLEGKYAESACSDR